MRHAGFGRQGGAIVVSAVLTVLGCSADSDRDGAVVRDSEGIRIVENAAARHPPLEDEAVGATLLAEIGRGEDPAHRFAAIAGAARLSDGTIAVLDAGAAELRLFDQDGHHLATVGGQGDGPEEFGYAAALAAGPADTLFVWDVGRRAVRVIGPDGQFLDAVPVPVEEVVPQPFQYGRAGPVGDGTLLVLGIDFSSGAPRARIRGRHRLPGLLLRYDPRVGRTDTVAFVTAHENFGVELDGRCCAGLGAPFGRDLAWAVRGGTVYLVDSGRPEVRRIDRSDGLESIDRLAIRPRPATDDLMARWREAYLADLDEAMRARLEPALARVEAPEVLPVFAAPFGVSADAAGRLWVQRYRPRRSTASSEFDILDVDGRWIRTVTLPRLERVFQLGDGYILALHRDALDVETVRLLPRRDLISR
ncbi:MAG: hypothetical protein ACODAE_09595 [Gemmatimonadota bacterium]